MTLIVPMLLYASETWTSSKVDLSHLQTFHVRCQTRILGVRWFHKIKNIDITRRTRHIGDLIQKRRHALFGHVVRMDPQAPAHVALKLCRDIAMGRRVPLGWRSPRGRPRSTWSDQLKKDRGKSVSTLWTPAQETKKTDPSLFQRQIAVEEGRDSLAGLRDLVVVVLRSDPYGLMREYGLMRG